HQGSYWRLPFPIDYHGALSTAKDAKHLLQFYVPLLLVIALGLVLVELLSRRTRPHPVTAGLAALGVCDIAYLLSRTDEFHWAPLLVVVAGLIAITAQRILAVPLLLILAALLASRP